VIVVSRYHELPFLSRRFACCIIRSCLDFMERGHWHAGAKENSVKQQILFITPRAKLSGAVYYIRSCLFVCGSVTTITRNCVNRSSPNSVCRWR